MDSSVRRDSAEYVSRLEDRLRILSETMRAFAEATTDYVDAQEPWFDTAYAAAWAWAQRTGWHAS